MNIYAIYINPEQKSNNFAIVREGFSWSALIFNIFWAFYHKMWLIVAFVIIVNIIMATINLQGLVFISKLTIMLIFGFFASEMREYDLRRKNYRLRDVVFARSEIEAELKFLERSVN
ncbi:DUF2628 domain-containing protein [Rickettsia endosymbiont of Halotydeus destructor]|uniref:DUF2628 domain-containing protein n=1 Tax=Rickettsia endosymbiont of Halotydeus destructor TaxID=2996754 RepID=UPI003BB1278B